jgi:prepilin-type processing-associated H-X9-DG protein/prepilin-type N-terminal cleavage/methylation domain-containing protein
MSRRAFTMVELLVVVGIVATLIGLLLPALSGVKRQAIAIECAANLRQWANAANLYATNNNGFLPRRGQGQQVTTVIDRPSDWFNALPQTLRQRTWQEFAAMNVRPTGGLWACRAAKEPATTVANPFHYGMNMRLSTWNAPTPDKITRVGPTSTLVFMADAESGYCSVLPFNAAFSPVARHDNRVNLAFLDGHVASYLGREVGCNAGDPNRADVRWKVPGSIWAGPTP